MTPPEDLQNIFDALPYPVFAKNSKHQWIYGNKAFDALIAVPDYIGKSDRDLFPADQVKVFWTEDRRVFGGEESINEEEIGPDVYALTRKVPYQLADGTTGLVGIIIASVTSTENFSNAKVNYEAEIEAARKRLALLHESSSQQALDLQNRLSVAEKKQHTAMEIAQTDSTTGLKNRLGFENALEASVRLSTNTAQRFGLAIVDVDHFKQINDRFGHAVGDHVLVTVAQRLTELPDVYAVARWGGDEFALLTELPMQDRDLMRASFNQALEYVFRPIRTPDRLIEISGSVGFAVYTEDAHDTGDLMRYADMALMTAKRRGRGMVQTFNQEIRDTLARRLKLARDLPDAITGRRIRPFYQPIMGTTDRKIQAVEALARWDHPELGPVSPEEFIAIAQESGLLSDLDTVILDTACREVGPWLKDRSITYLSVNASPMDIVGVDFAERFLASLEATGTNPEHICLEIVESAIVGNLEAAYRNLEHLSQAGVMIALDDYGTGFSNLRALLDLPLDKLKIDQSLIQSIGSNNKIADLMTSIMQLADTLQVNVVAEGIETKLQAAFVTSVGCHLMQGYLFSRPQSFDSLSKWLTANEIRAA
ncbi:sensor domain-containing protein [Hyphomonas johnsonii]|uniref:Putative diguanylate cyclase n=1 Tax=Hyphomonas johnsonii MHS-2 TaxID=1280950 RepID=A0A059FQI6_9PROT|nr:EAL domain-containing protein [Hyphomonas johnsonii]KCZ92930.1 putative diguanylate cyclase [Hyphomonas johnsonii MHS-2]